MPLRTERGREGGRERRTTPGDGWMSIDTRETGIPARQATESVSRCDLTNGVKVDERGCQGSRMRSFGLQERHSQRDRGCVAQVYRSTHCTAIAVAGDRKDSRDRARLRWWMVVEEAGHDERP